MQLVKTLEVTADEVFDAIAESVIGDVEQATGKRISEKKINGFKYTKLVGSDKRGQVKVRVKVLTFKRPELYRARFAYDDATDELSYLVEPAEDGTVRLTYTEEIKPTRPMNGLRAKFNLAVYEQRVRRRAHQAIRQLEYGIKERRRELNNPLLDELEAEQADAVDANANSDTAA